MDFLGPFSFIQGFKPELASSRRSNPLQGAKTPHLVNQIHEADAHFGAGESDATHGLAAPLGHPGKHMLDPTTGLGARLVAVFSRAVNGLPRAPLRWSGSAVALGFQIRFGGLGAIGAVSPNSTAGIAIVQQVIQSLGVVDAGVPPMSG
jgi:hypothetical protein